MAFPDRRIQWRHNESHVSAQFLAIYKMYFFGSIGGIRKIKFKCFQFQQNTIRWGFLPSSRPPWTRNWVCQLQVFSAFPVDEFRTFQLRNGCSTRRSIVPNNAASVFYIFLPGLVKLSHKTSWYFSRVFFICSDCKLD